MKKKHWYWFCTWLFLPLLAFAQAEDGALLYEISGKDLKSPSYVFGTIHLRNKQVYEPVAKKEKVFWECFNRCQTIAGELLFDKQAMKETAAQEMMLPAGITLQSLLSAEEYLEVKNYAKKTLGWKVILIERIQPMYTSALLMESMIKADRKWPLDIYLQKQGEKKGKKIAGIETIQEQMNAMGSVSPQEQAVALLDLVRNAAQSKQQLERMMDLYRNKRLLYLYALVMEEEMGEVLEADLITKRNYTMVERIEQMMLQGSVFSVLGAAHLPGEEGVLKLLQNKGYQVKPVLNTHY